MPIEFVTDPEDPRVAAYRDIRERDLTGREGLFIAEGQVVLTNLLSPAGLCGVRSLLIAESRIDALGELLAKAPPETPIYAAGQEVLNAVAGFDLHRGILALGEKPPERPVADVLAALADDAVVLACSGIGNHDNMGGLFRNAAAFGAAAVLMDDRCCDPFYRKAIRVSVGAVLRMPMARARLLQALVGALQDADFEVIALSPAAAEPLSNLRPGGRRALLVGSEGPGLPSDMLRRLRTVGIPMAGGFDSLNVATAAALGLNQLMQP